MGYTEAGKFIIKPHERHSPISDFPRNAIIFHHHSYYDLASKLAEAHPEISIEESWPHALPSRRLLVCNGEPIILVNSLDSSERTIVAMEELALKGTRNFINIGSAGAINQDLSLGDVVVGDRAIRDNGITTVFVTPDVEARSDPTLNQALWDTATNDQGNLKKIVRGDIWSTSSMYYTWDRLHEAQKSYDPIAVETEMAAVCIFAGWLNHNYGDRFDAPVRVGNLFYISVLLPKSEEEQWDDTMNQPQYHWQPKTQALLWAINTLSCLPDQSG